MKIFKKILFAFSTLLLLILLTLFLSMLGKAPVSEDISWGVTFSEKYARDLELDWQEAYLALFDDLGVEKVRIPIYWDLVEKEKGNFNFENVDWMMEQAQERNIQVIPVVGMRVPRWPECHIPSWAEEMQKEVQQEHILKKIEGVVSRYRDYENIEYWQVENEPFLTTFGECPWFDKDFLEKELELVREIDPETPILISESGELSTWFKSARMADIVGVSIYRQNWWHAVGGGYYSYPITPVHYFRKANIVKRFFDKEVICVELQAEPWGPAPTFIISLEEQEKSMDIVRFRENIEYAKNTGFSTYYLWGAEWWYWMKEKHGDDVYWEEAKLLFR